MTARNWSSPASSGTGAAQKRRGVLQDCACARKPKGEARLLAGLPEVLPERREVLRLSGVCCWRTGRSARPPCWGRKSVFSSTQPVPARLRRCKAHGAPTSPRQPVFQHLPARAAAPLASSARLAATATYLLRCHGRRFSTAYATNRARTGSTFRHTCSAASWGAKSGRPARLQARSAAACAPSAVLQDGP